MHNNKISTIKEGASLQALIALTEPTQTSILHIGQQERLSANSAANDQGRYHKLEQTIAGLNQQLIETELQLATIKRDANSESKRLTDKVSRLIECLPGGVIQLDNKGRIKASNAAAVELLGNIETGEYWLAIIDRVFSPKSDDGHEISLKNGRRVSLATRSFDDEPGQLILLTDQTETRQLQKKLHHHERLSTMGKMMAGLAHQIRTPLASATLYAAHLQDERLDSVKAKKFAGKILTQLNAIELQIRDMLVFARKDIKITDKVSVKRLMDSLEESMQGMVNAAGASYQLDIADPDVGIECNFEVLKGAILNLVENGIQAADNASLYIRADCNKGDSVTILVQDFGSGFDVTTIEGKNAAFMSSKPRGTGLGLSVVRAVVNAHHGQFNIRSAAKYGTSATITLPISAVLERKGEQILLNDREGSQSLPQGAKICEESPS